LKVEDWRDGNNQDNKDKEPYEIERIATILAVTCMFLSALYTIFAVLLFLYFGNEEFGALMDDEGHEHHNVGGSKPSSLGGIDPRRENFLTMGHEA
jgi:hypothetical protein